MRSLNVIDSSLYLLRQWMDAQADVAVQQEKKILSLEQKIDLMSTAYSKPLTRIIKDQITSEKIELEREAYKIEREYLVCRKQLDHEIALRMEAEKRAKILAAQLKDSTRPFSSSSSSSSPSAGESFLAPKSMMAPSPSTDHKVPSSNPFVPKKKSDPVARVEVSHDVLHEMDQLEETFASFSAAAPTHPTSSFIPSQSERNPLPRGGRPAPSPSPSPLSPPPAITPASSVSPSSSHSSSPSSGDDWVYVIYGISSNLKRRFLQKETPYIVTGFTSSEVVRFIAEKSKEIADLLRQSVSATFASNLAAYVVGICDSVIHLSSMVASNRDKTFYSILQAAIALSECGSDILASLSSPPSPLPSSFLPRMHPLLVEMVKSLKALPLQ